MVEQVHRDEVRRLAADGAQLVEVLPQPEYEDEHLPGAVNLPLKKLNAATASVLDRDRPVIVYCHDGQ
ncbi:MAG TPA: rhodanese-like domain-containing protein [Candidatus Binatia bacterium]|nr:rhodanese-like domain-containing protein [Candidatus Binatia bacterium]